MSQNIRIKLKSFDKTPIKNSADRIIQAIKTTGTKVAGPILLPTEKKVFALQRGPHVHKKSRQKYAQFTHKRLVTVYQANSKTLEALARVELPAGVEVEIKSSAQ